MESIIVNKRIETIGSDKDIVDIVRIQCGNDMANLIEKRLDIPLEQNITPELIETILKQTDFYSYEKSLDEWNCIGNDIIDECESMIKYMEESKKINKQKIYDSFLNIQKILQEIL